MFENMLAQELGNKSIVLMSLNHSNNNRVSNESLMPVWLEDESQRIGDLNIPHELWKTLRRSPVYFLDVPFEKRLERVVNEYGQSDKERLIDCILRIQKRSEERRV